jgi:hypothetical protein
MAFKGSFQVKLETLFEHLDLGQDYVRYPSDRKRTLTPVIALLRDKPLSTGILYQIDIQKTQGGANYKLVCRKRSNKQIESAEAEGEQDPVQMDLDWSNTPLEALLGEMQSKERTQ